MKGFRHVPGAGIAVGCRSCGEDLPGGPWKTSDEMFDVMKEHGWIKGPDICLGCQNSFGAAEAAGLVSFTKGDPWDFVEELAPGVWVPKSEEPKRRRRKIRRLV